MNCSRRIYRGNAYEICLPLVDSGVTLVRIYTRGDVIIEKEPEITADSMCIQLTADELAGLADGVIRYEAITDTDAYVTNSPYILITPDWYSGRTIDDIIQDAYDSGYTDGQEACTGGTCEGVYESGYTDGYQSGYTRGYQTGYADGLAACESGDTGDTADLWLEDMQGNIIQGETFVIPATSGTFSFKVVCVDDDIMWEMYNMPLMGTGTTEVDFEIPTNPGPDFYMGFYLTSPGATVLEDSWFRIVFDGAEPFFTLSLDYSRVNPDNIISGSTNDLVIKNDRRTPGIGVLLVTNTGYTFDYEEMLTGVKDIIGGPFPISGFGGHRTLTLDVPAHETQRQYVFTAYYGDNTVAGRFTISQIPDPTPPEPTASTADITAIYNATSTTVGTRILRDYQGSVTPTDWVSSAKLVDGGASIPVQETYTFPATGLNAVEFTLTGSNIATRGFQQVWQMTDVVIGSAITSIGQASFQSCSWLTGVTIPNSVTSMGTMTFENSGRLKTLTLPSSITAIPNRMVASCLGFTGMTISSAVTSVGDNAFSGCTALVELIFEGTTPPSLGTTALGDTTNTFPIYVPDAAVNTYKGASSWSGYASRVKGISQRP